MKTILFTREALGAARSAIQSQIQHHRKVAADCARDATAGILSPKLRAQSRYRSEAHTEMARDLGWALAKLSQLAELRDDDPAVVTIRRAGCVGGDLRPCSECGGVGQITRTIPERGYRPARVDMRICSYCDGEGVVNV